MVKTDIKIQEIDTCGRETGRISRLSEIVRKNIERAIFYCGFASHNTIYLALNDGTRYEGKTNLNYTELTLRFGKFEIGL